MNEMTVAIIFDFKRRKDTTGIYFKRALENLGCVVDHYDSDCYLSDSIPDQYDLHLCVDDGIDRKKPVRKYKNGVTAFYAIDTHLTFASKFEKAKNFDFVFCAQEDGTRKMKAKGLNAYWVHLGFDEETHGKQGLKKIYDLAFVGNLNTKERVKLANRYKDRYEVYIGKASHYEIGKIYSQSKIVLNWPIRNDINMRFFEALGSGTLLLSKKTNNGEVQIVKDGLHYVSFSNWRDLDRKIGFYLNNPELRDKIAKSGFDIAIKNFTYKGRLDLMLDIVGFKKTLLHPERLAILPYCVYGKGVEVGCGHRKTSKNCIGVDIIPKGEMGKYGCIEGQISKADICTSGDNLDMFRDSELDFVVSRHNLEHYVDIIKTLLEWKRVLKKGGCLAMVLPDERARDTISLDPTHRHCFTPESVDSYIRLIGGFKKTKEEVVIPNWSFLVAYKKTGSINV